MDQSRRISELDSLRGLAALSVVFLHFVDMYFPAELAKMRTPGEKIWLAILSPFYLGRQAVMLFFVLSGFVLALPYLRGNVLTYWQFIVRRYLRLYCPYLVALGIALAGDARWHGHLGMGVWADGTWSRPPDLRLIVDHILFLGNYDWYQISLIFWSLIIEMRISLVYPLLVRWVTAVKPRYSVLAGILAALLYRFVTMRWHGAEQTLEPLFYLGAFIAGILLAQYREIVSRWYQSLSRLKVLAFLTGTALFYVLGHTLSHLGQFLTLLGAVGLMILALASPAAKRLLNKRIPSFLGRISYSLYLIHIPVLFSLVFTLHHKVGKSSMFMLYLPLSLALATAFHFAVELPCTSLGQLVGRTRRQTANVYAR